MKFVRIVLVDTSVAPGPGIAQTEEGQEWLLYWVYLRKGQVFAGKGSACLSVAGQWHG